MNEVEIKRDYKELVNVALEGANSYIQKYYLRKIDCQSEDSRDVCIMRSMRRAIGALMDELSEKEKKAWIPVSERLPKENKTYICTVLRFVDDYVYSAELIYCPADDTWAWWDDPEGLYAFDYKTHRVVAWMPLPEPYKAE